MQKLMVLPFILMALLLSACQTSLVKQFSDVKTGMEKDDVLSLMGSPNRTQRFHGKDRWTYIFYEDRIRHEKEVQFLDGNAVYVGEPWQPIPEKSAAVVDAQTEERNKKLDTQLLKEVEKSRSDYSKYQEATKGDDKVRYVPQFESVR